MCDGHAVVCMRDPEIFVWGGGGGGEPASTEKGRYFLYIVSRGKVRTSIPIETYSTCDFRGGERVRSLTDFTRGGGGVFHYLSWGRISTVFLWKAIAHVIFQEGEGSSL